MRTCAIIVTFNRSQLLKCCIRSIQQQTLPVDCIVVVDNNSSDNTLHEISDVGFNTIKISNEGAERGGSDDTLSDAIYAFQSLEKTDAAPSPDLICISLMRNIGGAGGFNLGVRFAHKIGFDLFWLMDDDGEPDSRCLANLVKHTDTFDFCGPLVIDKDDRTRLSFGLPIGSRFKITPFSRSLSETLKFAKDDKIVGVANPFNGTLVTRRLVDNIGSPKAEFFIWGDEVEYMYRAKKAGFQVVTVTDAMHIHPTMRTEYALFFFNLLKVPIQKAHTLRSYCYFRNIAHIGLKHDRVGFLKVLIGYSCYYVSCGDINSLIFFLRAIRDGIFKLWGKERMYLN